MEVRKIIRVGDSRAVTIPRGMLEGVRYVKIQKDDGRLILEPLKEVV